MAAASAVSVDSADSGLDAQRDDDVDSQTSGSVETDEDVCYPLYENKNEQSPHGGVNIDELDVLLQLSDDGAEMDHAPESADSGSTVVTEQRQQGQRPLGPVRPIELLEHQKQMEDDAPEADAVPQDEEEDPEPQRFTFFATSLESTIHAKDIASLVPANESFSSLFTPTNGTWWLDCYNPTDQEVKLLSRAFGIHPLTSEDIRTEDSREKFELFHKYYFVCFHTFGNNPENEEYYLEPINFYIIVFTDGVLSFHFTPVSHCRNVRRRIRQLRDSIPVTSDWICYALLDNITDSFAPIIHDVESDTDYIEDHVYTRGHQDEMSSILERLVETRKTTMAVIRLLTGKADVIKFFAKRCTESWGQNAPRSEISLYLGDIQDHIVTMYQNLVAYEKILSRSHVNYMAQLQMEFVDSSNRMTTVLGKATLIGTVLIPMNLITGLFGMNVEVPGEHVENLNWWFGLLGFLIFSAIVLGIGANYWVNRLTR